MARNNTDERKSAMLYYSIDEIEKAVKDVFRNAKGELSSKQREYCNLFSHMLLENDLAISSFIKISAGLGLEKVIPNNTPVSIPINTLAYNSTYSEEEIRETAGEYIENDNVICQIQSFNGYHRYSPYTVCFPGGEELRTANIGRKDFTLLADLTK
tara:strand:- start:1083 stop:1550 length:468 start_codon:yes stop_codon:yes gene_type:complete